jgi:two-component system, OmpR family, sensor histidine kinase KdpD
MNEPRPNPDELLARVQAEESQSRRGKLKIFFGYAAGVGKTFAMLQAAQREKAAGVEVVVGYVEPHGRRDTEALLEGLETIPFREIPYRGVTLREFDLDAALARHPQLILVDELAHTNVEGSRHAKRWKDIEELLDAGISVWTTLNVQHIESLNDVIAQITNVIVRETLPDAILERADEIELVDVTPEELLDRLQAGKVYLPTQAERALNNFFHRGNLIALRELSLRQAATRLHRDVDAARHDRAATGPWATAERLLVCVGPSPSSAKIIRATKRMAAAMGAEWMAVAVDTARDERKSAILRQRVSRNLGLAEQLGAETTTLIGANVADALLDFARSRNATKIVVGKTAQPWWKRWLAVTVVEQLLARSADIDIYVISGEGSESLPSQPTPQASTINWRNYGTTAVVCAVCSFLGWICHKLGLAEANVVMVFLVGVAIVAARLGRGPAIVAAIVSVLSFDFFFVQPYLTFAVSDTQYFITFGVMLGIGLLISELTAQLRSRLTASQRQEQRTAQLYRMTRQLSELAGTDFLVNTAGRQLADIFAGEVVVLLREPDGSLQLRFGSESTIASQAVNNSVARWVSDNVHPAGLGTDTLPSATAFFVPMVGSQHTIGVLGVRPSDPNRFFDPEERRSLETCASLVALSIERDQSLLEANQAQVQVEAEQLRNSLLSSVSHDLRTPLATIAGTASSLYESATPQTRPLLKSLADESQRLARLVDNLLDMARLDSGSILLNRQWQVLEELVGVSLAQVEQDLKGRNVQIDLPADLPLLFVDGDLISQVMVNLVENAIRYTPPPATIEIAASFARGRVTIRVADNGPGLPPGSETKVFDKFFRGATVTADGRRGVGLGLAICRSIVLAHGGEIRAANRPTGGAEFTITLPCTTQPPAVTLAAATEAASA